MAVGFLAGKRVGWLNPITGTRAGHAAHEGLDRALSFGGADVVLRAEIPVTPRRHHTNASLAGPTMREHLAAALHQLLSEDSANPSVLGRDCHR